MEKAEQKCSDFCVRSNLIQYKSVVVSSMLLTKAKTEITSACYSQCDPFLSIQSNYSSENHASVVQNNTKLYLYPRWMHGLSKLNQNVVYHAR